jgi:hypothetical protein
MTVDENILLWWVALGLGDVVILVATILLMMIIGNAKTIHQAVSKIWDTGQRVANNTIHIPILGQTISHLNRTLTHAVNCIELTKPQTEEQK